MATYIAVSQHKQEVISYITLNNKFIVHLQNRIEQQTLQCHTIQVRGFTMYEI